MQRTIFKPLAALVLTAAGSAFIIGFKTSDTAVGAVASTAAANAGTSAAGTSSATASASADTSTATGSSGSSSTGSGVATASTYADGTWTGAAVNEPWGTFQVQVVVSGGQITNVNLVSAPSDRHSSSINSQAVPMLTQSVISAQSAQVDTVSGATWTSRSYLTSLQAALDDAAAATGTAQG